jgi:NTE family protein
MAERNSRFLLHAVLALLACFLPVYGQGTGTELPHRRPKVGLALEGGGALGLAHVGLLEWFEQHHIPIDYIAGTSMGGLVAGFYASGMEATEMNNLVESLNWDRLVGGEPDYQNLSLRRKQDVRQYGNSTFLGLRHNMVLPSGLNNGQGLNLLLSRVALPYGEVASFNDLPTPFRCVAADIAAGRAHVFEKGSLAFALRATMSIPALFEPVFEGNHEYVDGAFLNNLPVDVVKAMGADIVIAVYLANDPFDPKKPQSAVDVLSRSLSAVTIANERHNMEMADLLVSIDLTGFSTLDFVHFRDIIERGRQGGEKRNSVLSKFALDDREWAEFTQRRAAKRKITAPVPQFIEVQGISGEVAEAVHAYFLDEVGRPLEAESIETKINKIMGTNAFAYMTYTAVERKGRPGLLIYVHDSPSRPPMLQLALLLDGSDHKNTRFGVGARLTAINFGALRAELRNDVTFGSAYGLRSEYYRPLSVSSPWFYAPNLFAETKPIDIYRHNQPRGLYRQKDAGGGWDFGRVWGDTAELRVGYETGYVITSRLLSSVATFPVTRGRFGATHATFTLDRVDDEVVPHSGVLMRSRVQWVDANPGANEQFPSLEGTVNYFKPLGRRSTLFAGTEGGTIFRSANAGIPLYFLGGPQRLSAYGYNELYGNEYVLGRVGWMHQINRRAPVTDGRLYFMADYEVGRMFDFGNSTQAPMDVNAGFLVRTIVGPLFVGGSAGDSGHRKWYFQMGHVF